MLFSQAGAAAGGGGGISFNFDHAKCQDACKGEGQRGSFESFCKPVSQRCIILLYRNLLLLLKMCKGVCRI